MFRAIDPTSGALLEEHALATPDEARAAVERAARAQAAWREAPFAERAARLRALANALRGGAEAHARTMVREMGKPLAQARAEVEKCAWVCDHYAEHGEAFLAPEPVAGLGDGVRAYVAYRPLGVVLAIMPWNFPFWQLFRFAAPSWMAGNTVALKHAPNVPGCARAIEAVVREAGFPDGALVNLFADVETTGDLIDHPGVAAVTLTGSTAAGAAVAERAGRALKKAVLELGGSDAYVLLEDADVAAAADVCVTSRLVNNGQSCIAAKRFVVPRALAPRFEEAVVERMRAAAMGDPMDEGTRLGPMAREDLRDALHDQVERSVAAGARLRLGGEVPARPGWWYPATVLTDVGPGMAAYGEELFGPVATIVPVEDEREALRVANDSVYGLGGAVLTGDALRGEAIARDALEVGCAFVNDFVRSDPRLPFGGVKRSGHGRELGRQGIRELVNVKTVYVRDRLG